MKKITTFLFAVIACVTTIQAQSINWGISAGLNVSEYSSSVLKSKAGFHIGPKAEINLSNVTEGLYINTGLLITQKGAKKNYKSLGEFKLNPYFLEAPIHLGYKVGVSDKLAVFGDFGPYLAYGLFGKMKADINAPVSKEKYSYSEDIFGDDGVLKRFDMGLGIRAGFEFMNKYQLAVTYDWGLLKTWKNSDTLDKLPEKAKNRAKNLGLKNRNMMVSFSYMF